MGLAVLAAGLGLYALALDRLRRRGRALAGGGRRWFGYLTDAVNVAGLGLCTGAFVAAGWAVHRALVAGALAGLAAYGLDAVLGGALAARRTPLWVALATLSIVGPAIVYSAAVESALDRAITRLWG
jgi:hypothetical protein